MRKKIRWMAETAIMLALLVTLQAATKSLGQLVTGSFVNGILAVTVLVVGLCSGLVLAFISPVLAFLLGIAPNFVTVFPIMLGNACYVAVFHLLLGQSMTQAWKRPVAVAAAAALKFGVLYLLVVKLICGVASGALLGKKIGQIVVLAPPMLKLLPTMFSWPQLFTALIGGAAAVLIVPMLQKALHQHGR